MRILSPVDGEVVQTQQITLRVALRRNPAEAKTRLRAFVDGQLVAEQRGFGVASSTSDAVTVDETVRTLAVVIPPRDTLVAVATDGPDGEPPGAAQIHLRWGGTLSEPFTVKPRLYVLAVGVSRYAQEQLALTYPAKDARDFAAAFQDQEGGLYARVETRVLTDDLATKSNILEGLEWLQRQSTARDLAVLFLAGHGINDPATGSYQFLPYEADPRSVKRTMLSQNDLQTTLQSLPGKVLLFLDSCHAGNVFGVAQRGMPELSSFIGELIRAENGITVFASSTGRQAAQESMFWNNGAFTKAVVEGVRGRAAYHPQRPITLNMLDLYISERVKELTAGTQTPSTAKPSTLPDFPVALALSPNRNSAARPPAVRELIQAPPQPLHSAQSTQKPPLYKRAWFWGTLLGGAAAIAIVGGIAGGIAARTSGLDQIYDLPRVR